MENNLKYTTNKILQKSKEQSKSNIKTFNNRQKYYEIYEWSKNQLIKIDKDLQNQQEQSQIQQINEQKKVILSMLLQIGRLSKQQCIQKGILIQQMLHFVLKFVNQHQKHYDMLSYMQIKHFRDSIEEMERLHQQNNRELTEEIKLLKQDKQHRWRNIFMVVKDNRVLRRRNSKLLKTHRELVWKIKQIQQDLINLQSQSQKYKLLSEETTLKQGTMKRYISNQLLLNRLNQKIKLYPGRARRILKKQLVDLQINQLNTLQQKMKFIIQSMEQNGEVCQQFDSWNDNIQTTRLFYNVSVQTFIQQQCVGVNTVQPHVPQKSFQSIKVQSRPKDFVFLQPISKTFEVKIAPKQKKVEKKRNQQSLLVRLSQSRFKKRISVLHTEYQNSNQSFVKRSNDSQSLRIQKGFDIKISGLKKRAKNIRINALQQNNQDLQYMIENLEGDQKYKNNNFNDHKLNSKYNRLSKKQAKYQNQYMQNLSQQNICNFTTSQNYIAHGISLQFISQIYKLYYKPFTQLKQIQQQQHIVSRASQNKIKDIQQHFYLQQKLTPIKISRQKQSKQIKNSNAKSRRTLQSKQSLINDVQLKHKKRKTQANLQIYAKKYLNFNNQAITQVYQNNSNKTIEQFDGIQTIKSIKLMKQESKSSLGEKKSLNKKKQHTNINQLKQKDLNLTKIKQHRNVNHRRINTQNLQTISTSSKTKHTKLQQQLRKPSKIELVALHHNNQKLTKGGKSKISQISVNQNQMSCLSMDKQSLENKAQINTLMGKAPSENKYTLIQERFVINNEKNLQKLMANIYERRKQIIANPQTLIQFIQNFILSLMIIRQNTTNPILKNKLAYKFLLSIRQINNRKQRIMNQNLMILFEKLVPNRGFNPFSEDIFVLFAVMLDKLSKFGVLNLIDNLSSVPKIYGIKVLQYLCSIYLSKQQCSRFIQKLKLNEPSVNMVQVFNKLVNQLQTIVFQSQLWQFFQNITSCFTQNINQEQLLELMSVFKFVSVQHQKHRENIMFYASSKNFNIHRLCLYAHRFNWRQIKYIKTWIKQRYLEYFGFFSLTDNSCQIPTVCSEIELKLQRYSKRFEYLLRTYKKISFKWKNMYTAIDQSYLKLCKLAIYFYQLQNANIYPNNLQIIQECYGNKIRTVNELQNVEMA